MEKQGYVIIVQCMMFKGWKDTKNGRDLFTIGLYSWWRKASRRRGASGQLERVKQESVGSLWMAVEEPPLPACPPALSSVLLSGLPGVIRQECRG